MYEFMVRANIAHTGGPFASRDDLEAELVDALESADPGSLDPGDSEYEVLDWTVEPGTPAKADKAQKSAERDWLEAVAYWLADYPAVPFPDAPADRMDPRTLTNFFVANRVPILRHLAKSDPAFAKVLANLEK